jgi:probable O-glycosylation ligase (exosortase A-associated)
MGRLLVYLLLGGSAVSALGSPWIGVTILYLIILMVPQDIWWWHFSHIRPVFLVMIPTLIGFVFAAFGNKYSFKFLLEKRYIFFFLLWGFYYISYVFGPYTDVSSPYRWYEPSWMISNHNKTFILFFISCICINDERRLLIFFSVFVVASIYLTIWINNQYLFHGLFGRIGGPTGLNSFGVYTDENSFASFFVASLPFVYYAGFIIKKKVYKFCLWGIIPLGWHAVFLTGSRGGLLGLCATIVFTAFRSKKKILGMFIILFFCVAYIWQAGDLMKNRARTIEDFHAEESARTRLEAWEAAIKMALNYPITGVGLASFGVAYPDHSDKKPREAHNSFFQVIGENGIFAGFLYLVILIVSLRTAFINSRYEKKKASNKTENVFYVNEAAMTSLIGLYCCSVFLSMNMSELLFYVFAVVNIVKNIKKSDNRKWQESIKSVF